MFFWTGTGILGNKVENHSSFVRKERSISPMVITQPPPALTSRSSSSSRKDSNQSHRSVGGWVYLIYINPRALIYGESVCVMRPITCFRVNFRVNNLYRRQNAVETMPPVPTPRTPPHIPVWPAVFLLPFSHGSTCVTLK